MDAARTVSLFADEEKVLCLITITDRLKPTSKEAVEQLHRMGIEVVIYTGDNEKAVAEVARQLNISSYKGNVQPEEKAELVKQLQQQGKVVAMVGDGINDSAALAQADVSIAMGRGSDIAMDVAKMTIISSDLTKIPKQSICRNKQSKSSNKIFLGIFTTSSAFPLLQECYIRLPVYAQPHDCRCRNGVEFGECGKQQFTVKIKNMKTLQFKTNIHCSNCVAKLNLFWIKERCFSWKVDIDHPTKS